MMFLQSQVSNVSSARARGHAFPVKLAHAFITERVVL